MCRLSSGTAIISLLGDTANLTRKKKSDATFCESDAGAAPWACRLDLGSGWIRCGAPPHHWRESVRMGQTCWLRCSGVRPRWPTALNACPRSETNMGVAHEQQSSINNTRSLQPAPGLRGSAHGSSVARTDLAARAASKGTELNPAMQPPPTDAMRKGHAEGPGLGADEQPSTTIP